MFSLFVGYSSWKQRLLGLLLAAGGVAFCFAYDNDPGFLGFHLSRQIAYFLMILLGLVIGLPVRVLGYKSWIGFVLALGLGGIAFVLLVLQHNLSGTIVCLLAEMELVGSYTKPDSLRALLDPSRKF